jgi:hypothetical protein
LIWNPQPAAVKPARFVVGFGSIAQIEVSECAPLRSIATSIAGSQT